MRFRPAAWLAFVVLAAGAAAATLTLRPPVARAYANGVPAFVTDAAPYCAGCHSSCSRTQLREMSLAHQEAQYMENKHYGPLLRGEGRYASIPEGDRKAILDDVRMVDANTTVALSGLRDVKVSQVVELTVTVHGGGGPLVGVMLVDADYRYQARPLASSGWYVSAAPRVIGPDGTTQTTWQAGRARGLKDNLSFVEIDGITCDLATKTFPTSTVIWQLRAPREPGTYPVVACLLYGTEKSASKGWTELPNGERIPVGGRDAPSGRIMFSAPLLVKVR